MSGAGLNGLVLAGRGLGVRLGTRRVLDAIDFEAHPGHITGLIGPNGAGKSTLLRTLAGLLAADAGRVTLGGEDVAGLTRLELARRLALLPQDRTVHWPLAVRDMVSLGRLPFRSLAAGESDQDRAIVDAALTAMEVQALAARAVTELSGGELARVLMARALAQQPKVLLADEPAAGLDPAHQLKAFAHLAALAGAGMTVVVALHDLSLAARFCHRIVLLKSGRGVASGAPAAVLTPPLLAKVYGIDAHVGAIDGVPVVLPLGLSGSDG